MNESPLSIGSIHLFLLFVKFPVEASAYRGVNRPGKGRW